MRPLIIAALLCTFGACSCDSSPCLPTGGGAGGGAGGPVTQIGYVGKPVDVPINLLVNFAGCADTPTDQFTGAVVEVLDPSSQKVAATATDPEQTNGVVSCTVTFTPATPGPYHVALRFTPNGATVQRDLVVAVDKRSLTANTFALGPDHPQCDQIDFDGQTLLCHDAPNGNQRLHTLRQNGGSGVTISTVRADAFALDDGRVWVHDPLQGLSIYGLGSDGSLALRGSFPLDSQGDRPKILAHNDQALFIDDLGFQQLSLLTDGGFSSSGLTRFDHATGAQWLPGAGATVFADFETVCSWALTAASPADPDAGSCTQLDPQSVVGYDDDGVWWLDKKTPVFNGQTVFVAGWHGGAGHATSGSISFLAGQPPNNPPGQAQQSSPLLFVSNSSGATIDLLVPRFDGNFTWFEHYPSIDPAQTVFADSRFIWFVDTTTWVLTYYQR